MKLPYFIYRSQRIGKKGKIFSAYKIRTLKDNPGNFPEEDQYLKYGKFLRKTKLDELPQIFNVLKGDMAFVGPRPELEEHIHLLPTETRRILLSVKPGLTSLASIHFADEETLIQGDAETYWKKIKPLKVALDVFYIQNRCFLLDTAIVWLTAKLVIKKLFQ